MQQKRLVPQIRKRPFDVGKDASLFSVQREIVERRERSVRERISTNFLCEDLYQAPLCKSIDGGSTGIGSFEYVGKDHFAAAFLHRLNDPLLGGSQWLLIAVCLIDFSE